jgi:hypothetical protein
MVKVFSLLYIFVFYNIEFITDLVLGTNLETQAQGFYSIKCILQGIIMESDAVSPEAYSSLHRNHTTPNTQSSNFSNNQPHRAETHSVGWMHQDPGSLSRTNSNPMKQVDPFFHKPLGRYRCRQTHNSNSVLEMSMEEGDIIEVIYWEEDDLVFRIFFFSLC